MAGRIVGGLLVLVLVGFGVRWLVHALASDETLIRWRIEAVADGFNDESSGPALRLLAPDYVDDSSGADRDLVRAGMARLFFQERDPQTKRFLLRLELVEDRLAITVDGDRARAAGLLRLFERRDGEAELRWEVSFEGELVKDEQEGWRVVRSRHETLAGERPR